MQDRRSVDQMLTVLEKRVGKKPGAGTWGQDGQGENGCEKVFHDRVLHSVRFRTTAAVQ